MMPAVDVVVPGGESPWPAAVLAALKGVGVRARVVTASGGLGAGHLVIGIADPLTPELALELGVRIGAGLPTVFAARANDLKFPAFAGIPQVSLDGADPVGAIARVVMTALKVRRLPPELEHDRDGLVTWLRADSANWRLLKSRHMVDLVEHLFRGSGFRARRVGDPSEPDLWMESPTHSQRWMVHCKASSDDAPIGIGAVHRLHTACVRSRSDFAMLVSNATLTPAAREWAAECCPPVHIVEREQLESLLTGAMGVAPMTHAAPGARYGDIDKWRRRAAIGAARGSDETVPLVDPRRWESNRSVTWKFDVLLTECAAGVHALHGGVISGFKRQLESRGVRLWSRGRESLSLGDLAKGVSDSAILVLLAVPEAGTSPTWDHRVVHTIAHELAHFAAVRRHEVVVVAPESAFTRLTLPTSLDGATFVDCGRVTWGDELATVVAELVSHRTTRRLVAPKPKEGEGTT